jgi:hypothetical protein
MITSFLSWNTHEWINWVYMSLEEKDEKRTKEEDGGRKWEGIENDLTKPKERLKSEYFRWVLAHDHRY